MNRTSTKLIPGQPHQHMHRLEHGGKNITTFVPLQFRKRGIRKVLVAPREAGQPVAVNTGTPELPPQHDLPLLKALGRAHYWQQLLDNGTVADTAAIAKRESANRVTVNATLRLALLAPDIIQGASDGTLPRTVSLEALLRATLPASWDDQRRVMDAIR